MKKLLRDWAEKIATANFIIVLVFIEGLKPEIKNEMIRPHGGIFGPSIGQSRTRKTCWTKSTGCYKNK
jgi:hypothetical protein